MVEHLIRFIGERNGQQGGFHRGQPFDKCVQYV